MRSAAGTSEPCVKTPNGLPPRTGRDGHDAQLVCGGAWVDRLVKRHWRVATSSWRVACDLESGRVFLEGLSAAIECQT